MVRWRRAESNCAAVFLPVLYLALLAVSVGLAEHNAGAQASRAPLIPNASRIRARVVKYSIWDAALVSSRDQQAIYSLVLDVCASEKVGQAASLVKVGDRIEAFSRAPLSGDLFGKTIQSTVRASGDERGQRFWLRDVRLARPGEACPAEKNPSGSERQE